MKKYLFLLIPLFFLTACAYEESSNTTLWKQQEQIMKESVAQVGMPGSIFNWIIW